MANERLYVAVRRDLASMTPGKAQAHSGHAANAAVHHVLRDETMGKPFIDRWAGYGGFGTQINLNIPWVDFTDIIFDMRKGMRKGLSHRGHLNGGIILDPSYPYKDGSISLTRPEHTAIWIMCDSYSQSFVDEHLGKYPLA